MFLALVIVVTKFFEQKILTLYEEHFVEKMILLFFDMRETDQVWQTFGKILLYLLLTWQ